MYPVASNTVVATNAADLMAALSLNGVSIHRDAEGRYSFNDFHAAAAGAEADAPSKFLRLKKTKALIAELEKQTIHICPVSTAEGRNGGTYGVENLVIAYAAWISAKFYAHVLETFKQAAIATVHAERVAPQPAPTPEAAQSKLIAELAVAECMARLTNVSESGKLAMIHAICSKNAVDTHFLPRTAVDGPAGTVSSLEAECATELLKRRGEARGIKAASAIAFNKRAKLAGYLRETSRQTTDLKNHPDGRKRYLIVTPKGEAFGKNVVDIQSPRQTQPRWYTDRFDAFCKLLWAETKGLTD